MTAEQAGPAVRDVKMMGALGAIADEVVRGHGQQPADRPSLPAGLAGEPRKPVFDYLSLDLPEDYLASVVQHARFGEHAHVLGTSASLATVVDDAWAGDDDAARASLVRLGADVVRWIKDLDHRRAQALLARGVTA